MAFSFLSLNLDSNQLGALQLTHVGDGSRRDGISPSVLIQRRMSVKKRNGTERLRKDMARKPHAKIENGNGNATPNTSKHSQCDNPCLPGFRSFHSSITMLHPRHCYLLASDPAAPWPWSMQPCFFAASDNADSHASFPRLCTTPVLTSSLLPLLRTRNTNLNIGINNNHQKM